MALSHVVAGADVRRALSKKVVALYQRICRAAPAIVKLYSLENTASEVRHLILLHFRKNPTNDPRAIELLLARAEMTFQEVTEQWSQRPHLLALLQPEIKTPEPLLDPEAFFDRFIDGTLTEEDLWLGHDRAAQQRALAQMRAQRVSRVAAREALLHRAAEAAASKKQLR